MKKQILRAFAILSLFVLSAGASASAQTAGVDVLRVPFDFVAGEKRLPAGEYRVRRVSRDSDKTLLIRSTDGRHTAMLLTNAAGGRAERGQARLDFYQYEGRYFLAHIWAAGVDGGREVTASRLEQELARASGGRDAVAARRAGKSVTVLARTP